MCFFILCINLQKIFPAFILLLLRRQKKFSREIKMKYNHISCICSRCPASFRLFNSFRRLSDTGSALFSGKPEKCTALQHQNSSRLHIFTQSAFTLIELLVLTAQHCRDFFRGFICTDQYGCVRKHTENTALKNTPLFLKAKGSARGK